MERQQRLELSDWCGSFTGDVKRHLTQVVTLTYPFASSAILFPVGVSVMSLCTKIYRLHSIRSAHPFTYQLFFILQPKRKSQRTCMLCRLAHLSLAKSFIPPHCPRRFGQVSHLQVPLTLLLQTQTWYIGNIPCENN